MFRRNVLFLLSGCLLTVACYVPTFTAIAQQKTFLTETAGTPEEAFNKIIDKINDLGYHLLFDDRDSGVLQAEKAVSRLGSSYNYGNPGHFDLLNITVAANDSLTTRIQIDASSRVPATDFMSYTSRPRIDTALTSTVIEDAQAILRLFDPDLSTIDQPN